MPLFDSIVWSSGGLLDSVISAIKASSFPPVVCVSGSVAKGSKGKAPPLSELLLDNRWFSSRTSSNSSWHCGLVGRTVQPIKVSRSKSRSLSCNIVSTLWHMVLGVLSLLDEDAEGDSTHSETVTNSLVRNGTRITPSLDSTNSS